MNTSSNAALSDDNKVSRRLNIVQAAANLFAQQGFEGTSISAIADAAAVKKTLVQYHFESKDNLWRETVRFIWQARTEALPQYLNQDLLTLDNEEHDMVRELCRAILNFTFDQPQWVKLMFQEASTPGPRLDWMVEEFFTSDFNDGKAMISLAQSYGLLPEVDAMDLLHILSGALIYLVNVAPITERVLGVKPSSEAYIDHHVDTLMRILQSHNKDAEA